MLKYSDLTAEQKAKICNGCGPKGGLIPIPDFLFKASCDQHDFYYWRGGDESHREVADTTFYKYMKIDIEDKGLPLVPYLIAHSWAYAYYSAVKYFGKSYFYYGEPRTILDI